MGSKPVAEGGHQGWIGGQILNGFTRANSAPNEVTMEELHSELSVIANFSTLKMRASATSKMVAKGIKYVQIDVAQNTAFPLNKAAEMAAARMYRTVLAGAYPSRSRSSANASICGPLIPPRKRFRVLGAEKNFSSISSPCCVL